MGSRDDRDNLVRQILLLNKGIYPTAFTEFTEDGNRPDPIDQLVATLKGMSADKKRTEIVEAYLYALDPLTGKQVGKILATFADGPERLATLQLLIINQKLQKDVDFDSIMARMHNDAWKVRAVALFKKYNLLPKGTTALNLQKHFYSDTSKVELFRLFTPKAPTDNPPPYTETPVVLPQI